MTDLTEKITSESLADIIEKTLENQDEEDNQAFDDWFNSYVNSTATEKDNRKDKEPKVADESVHVSSGDDVEANEQEVVEHSEDGINVPEDKQEDKQPVEQDASEELKLTNMDVLIESTDLSHESESFEHDEPKCRDLSNDEQNTSPEHQEPELSPPEQTTSTETSTETLPEPSSRKRRRVKKHKRETPGETKVFPSGVVEIGKEVTAQPSDREILENISKSKSKLITDINEQVKEMEENGNCKRIDPAIYTPGSDLSNVFYQYIIGKLFVPKNCVLKLDINEYINNTTVFKYNAFDAPNVGMQHPIPEKVIYMNKLNNIFNYEFINAASGDFHFNDLDKQIVKFLHRYKDYGTTKLEYGMIKSLLGKLIIALNTSCELALRDNTKPTINTEFKQAIIGDIECMKFIQAPMGKLYTSWKTFLNALLSIGSDNMIYVHDNYPALNTKLKTAYDNDFLTENLFANMLKCYLPSVAINYFYVAKSIYISTRLLSIYIQEKKYIDERSGKVKEFEQIVNEIYTIGAAGVVLYENKSYIFKQIPRSLPKYDKQITEQTQMYILNHLLTGAQYYILKMFEESLPIVASLLTS